MTLVLDASMALAWLFERADPIQAECADKVLSALTSYEVVVPPLWHVETANALLVAERRKVVTEAQVADFVSKLGSLPITTDSAAPAERREVVMALAREHRLTAYDATYLDLALRNGAALATFDGALASAMRNAGGVVFA
ncbi:type II toxin-antitoxin system VapC family toxin [Cupriavidus basilensis]|uniref:type II toxin-antitoxin system VapC family toxin n=1 Tax=Cupriavidus basilensis TaxID=68895 RepID=UPI00283FA284|nr:type II toxin-antitoxin system VapC family toxin [Cupriavidus basilensis]MDR3383001.1 type II toxin-antitoxin system VapC family toxin [Cupriavidus basilensis]